MHSSSTSVNSPSAEFSPALKPSFFSNACEHVVAAAQHARDVRAHQRIVLPRRARAGTSCRTSRRRRRARTAARASRATSVDAPRRRCSRTRPARGAGRAGRRPARWDSGPRMAAIFCWASGENASGIEVREQLRLWSGVVKSAAGSCYPPISRCATRSCSSSCLCSAAAPIPTAEATTAVSSAAAARCRSSATARRR